MDKVHKLQITIQGSDGKPVVVHDTVSQAVHRYIDALNGLLAAVHFREGVIASYEEYEAANAHAPRYMEVNGICVRHMHLKDMHHECWYCKKEVRTGSPVTKA